MSNYKEECRRELEQLVKRERQLDSALLCTSDGLPIVHAASTEIEADALSAMCSSMLSLGDALAIQGEDESCIQVVTQSKNQTVAMIHAGEETLLVLIGSKDLKLGMLLVHARKQVDIIVELINRHAQEALSLQETNSDEQIPVSLQKIVQHAMQETEEL